MSHVSADRGEEEAKAQHPGMRKRHSSFLSDMSGELIDVPVQRAYVFGSSRGSLAPAHSQLGAVEEKGEGEGSAELNLLSEAEPDHRTGTYITAIGHILTAVIGAGVLNLPFSISMLGWAAGPLCVVLFGVIVLYTTQLLADLYIVNGERQSTYTQLVDTVFGRAGFLAVAVIQNINLCLMALAYTITAVSSMQSIAVSACSAHEISNACFSHFWQLAIIFGVVQIFMTQLPSLEHFWWASIIGAIMSIGYSLTAFGLSVAQGNFHGTLGGQSLSPSGKAFGIMNALGGILFSYAYSMVAVNIQDTLRSAASDGKHGPIKTMKRAVNTSAGIMMLFYLLVGCAGYAAFGNSLSGNILDEFDGPTWVLDMANAMVLLHLVPAYQVYSQVFLCFTETQIKGSAKAPAWAKGVGFRVGFRTSYVLLITLLACIMPFFSSIVGLVGAIGFWPIAVSFPVEMWVKTFKPERRYVVYLRCLSFFCFLVSCVAIIGSVRSIIVESGSFKIFGN